MKVTFVNGEYQGRVRGQQDVVEVRERMYDSCPDLCPFLERVGAEGWELVAAYAVPFPEGVLEKLIFKRPR
jgi:hypothetical protein